MFKPINDTFHVKDLGPVGTHSERKYNEEAKKNQLTDVPLHMGEVVAVPEHVEQTDQQRRYHQFKVGDKVYFDPENGKLVKVSEQEFYSLDLTYDIFGVEQE